MCQNIIVKCGKLDEKYNNRSDETILLTLIQFINTTKKNYIFDRVEILFGVRYILIADAGSLVKIKSV